MSSRKELKKFIRELEREGWTVVQGIKHFKAHHPKGGFIVMSGTPSDGNAIKNMRRDAERLRRSHDSVLQRV